MLIDLFIDPLVDLLIKTLMDPVSVSIVTLMATLGCVRAFELRLFSMQTDVRLAVAHVHASVPSQRFHHR